MDTKSKKFNDHMAVRMGAFILCVIFFTVAMMVASMALSLYRPGIATAVFEEKSYQESGEFYSHMYDKTAEGLSLLQESQKIESMKNGSVDQDTVKQSMWNLYYEGVVDIGGQTIYANPKWFENGGDAEAGTYEGMTYEGSEDPRLIQKFQEINKAELNQISNLLIGVKSNEMKTELNHFGNTKGFSYYISDGKNILTNVPSGTAISTNFTKEPAYLVYEKGKLERSPSNQQNPLFESLLSQNYNENLVLYFSFDGAYMEKSSASYEQAKDTFKVYFPILMVSAFLTLLLFFYLAITTGRKDELGNWKLYKVDQLYTEVPLCAVIVCGVIGIAPVVNINQIINNDYYNGYVDAGSYGFHMVDTGATSWLSFIENTIGYTNFVLHSLLIVALASVGLWFILSWIRLLKSHTWLQQSILYRIFHLVIGGLKTGFQSIYRGGSVMKKVVLITLCICLLSATIFLAPVVFILVLLFAQKWITKYEAIKKGVTEVKNGNLSYKIPINGEGEFDELAKDINAISEASSIAIQNELKNQRLKTDLISNVSHDLKTPLTSIITYIDLLKTEGLDYEEAPKYLEILEQKADRLKSLTEDLFEAAKASSGAIPVKLERVDLISLINQGLGELSHGISDAGLTFKINSRQEKYYVNADGQLL
ncbi:MAG: HAMP domain-containing sensor histidine kinase, partial [Anaerovorax sp.]